eukprot:14300195-Ditylum_brightwellii.AAC.1
MVKKKYNLESHDNESNDNEEEGDFEEQGSSNEEDLLEEQAALSNDDEDESEDEVYILKAKLTSIPHQWHTSLKEDETMEEQEALLP